MEMEKCLQQSYLRYRTDKMRRLKKTLNKAQRPSLIMRKKEPQDPSSKMMAPLQIVQPGSVRY